MRFAPDLRELARLGSSLGRLVRMIWGAHRLGVIGTLGGAVLDGLIPAAAAWTMKLLLDHIATTADTAGEGWSQRLVGLIMLQAAILIAAALVSVGRQFLSSDVQRELSLTIEQRLYEKLNSLPGIKHLEQPSSHDAISLAQQGVGVASSQAVAVVGSVVAGIVGLGAFLSILFELSPTAVFVILVGTVPSVWVGTKIAKAHYELASEVSGTERRVSYLGFLLSNPKPAREVRAFGIGSYLLTRLLDQRRWVNRKSRAVDLMEARLELLTGGIAGLATTLAVALIVVNGTRGEISIGQVSLGVAAVFAVGGAFQNLVLAIADANQAALFFTYFDDVQHLEPLVLEQNQPKKVPTVPAGGFRGLEFHNISFRFNPSQPWVLRNLDLQVPEGSTQSIVGLNGAGKSTLVKLVLRLYDPSEGSIRWNGVDIRELEVETWRRTLGVAYQDFMNYDTSIRENVAVGNLDDMDNDDRLLQVLDEVGLGDDVRGLASGLDTEASLVFGTGAEGLDLSGGQWQKIALARTLLRRPSLLVMDEPTASLDPQSEYEFNARLAAMNNGCTRLLVSHRFGTVRMADQIAVMESGRITENGTHRELLAQGGTYAGLYKSVESSTAI